MTQNYGIEAPGSHEHGPLRAPARYLVLISAGGDRIARLFDAQRAPLAEFDAGTEEVAVMTRGLQPAHGVDGPDWDQALASHDAAERADAALYTLDV